MDQVREAFDFLFTGPDVEAYTTTDGDTLSLISRETDKVWNCIVEKHHQFKFNGGKLYHVTYLEQNPPGFTQEKGPIDPFCGGLVLHRFKTEAKSLYKQHGKPTKDEEYDKLWILPSTAIEIEFVTLPGKTFDAYYFSMEYEQR